MSETIKTLRAEAHKLAVEAATKKPGSEESEKLLEASWEITRAADRIERQLA